MHHLLLLPKIMATCQKINQLRCVFGATISGTSLTWRTDLEVDISNQCGRLIANVVIAYNSMLLSGLLGRYLATGNWQSKGAGLAQANFTSGVAASAFPEALCLQRQAQSD